MVAGARSFFPRVSRPYRDARSHLYIEDAKSYFARHGRRYDVILSEPSNPWVNGVATLFTTEFYRDTKRYLAPGGLFVQWIQHYEFNDRLLGSVLGAMAENFADFEVYECSQGDLLIVAVVDGKVPPIGDLPKNEPAFLEQMKRFGVTGPEHLAARWVGGKRELIQYLAPLEPPVNSDFYPFVQLEATRARFANRTANATLQLALSPLPLNEMLSKRDARIPARAAAAARREAAHVAGKGPRLRAHPARSGRRPARRRRDAARDASGAEAAAGALQRNAAAISARPAAGGCRAHACAPGARAPPRDLGRTALVGLRA
jgi:hypothetical protein